MIQKYINKKWINFDGLKHIKKGDIFRCIDNGNIGPILKSTNDAKYEPSPIYPHRMVWRVKAPKHILI